MKKIYWTIILSIILVFNLFTQVYADINFETNSEGLILINAKTGKVLYEENADKKLYPASTTKILTAIIAIEKCSLTETAVASKEALNMIPVGYSIGGIKAGEEFTIEQLLDVFLIHSANEVGNILAEHVSGSVSEFVNLMNEKAKSIGCTNTNFTTTNGVHDKNHYSTARDMAIIARYCMTNETFRNIVSKSECSLPSTKQYPKDDRKFSNTNSLMLPESDFYYEYTNGIKTGFTTPAKHCLIGSAKKDDVELICVVLGSNTSDNRYRDSKNLLSFGIDNFSYKSIVNKNDIVKNIDIVNATSKTKSLNLVAENNVSALLENSTDISKFTPEVNFQKTEAPILQGEVVATATYNIDGETYSINLLAQNEVKAKLDLFGKDIDLLIGSIAAIGLILFIFKSKYKKKPKTFKATYFKL